MAQANSFTKSMGILNKLSDNLVKNESESEGEKATLFSLSTNIHRWSDLVDNSDGHPWVSSFDSLNQCSSDLEKNSFRREDLSMATEYIEEEKDDDFDRDFSMDGDEFTPSFNCKPILRKRMSLQKMREDIEYERIANEENEWRHPKEEDFLELRKSDMVLIPKRLSKLRKLRSEVYNDSNPNSIFNGERNESHYGDLPLWDKTNLFNRINDRLSPRKSMKIIRDSIRKEMEAEPRHNKIFGDSPFGPCVYDNQENINILPWTPIKNADLVNPKLYKEIDITEGYTPLIELIDTYERKHPSMNSISCHSVSKQPKIS